MPGKCANIDFGRVGVRRAQLLAAAGRGADHHRDGVLAVKHVPDLRHRIDDRVHGDKGKVDRHQFGNRAQTGHRRADRRADDHHLGDRRITHALFSELIQHAARHGVGAAPHAHFLTHDKDTLIALHFFAQGRTQRFAVRNRFVCHLFL